MSASPEPALAAVARPTRVAPRAAAADLAVLRTVVYAGLFEFPLTLAELHRRLMDVPLEHGTLRARLAAPFLRERLVLSDGLVVPRGRESWLALRQRRAEHSRELVARHRPFLELLCRFPFVRLVALSGACAHENASDDDVDIFLIVKRERAWAVTLALMLLSRGAGVRRTLCLNYVLDEAAAALPEAELFTAAEIVGMRPLAGRRAYRSFVNANGWVARFFPNFYRAHIEESELLPEAGAPAWLERSLELGPAPLLEALGRLALGPYLRRKARGAPGVVLSPHQLKLHLEDHRPELTVAFARALRDTEPLA